MAEEESLVSRRPKRSTAGNRMELALAELALDEPQELEEDIDFVVEKDEEDVFESDFASTDEEAAQDDIDEGDRAAREEERRDRKTARARAEKATAAAHARQRVTFNPEVTTPQPRSQIQKPKRRVSLGVVVNAETGEVIEGGAGTAGAKRQSQRRHTVMNTSATVNRIKDAEEKRAAIPKKAKMATRLPTQDELIARALDTEEGNITEHRDYLRLEEEKRARARVVKQAIEGPVLRWISKKETIQVEVKLPAPPLPPTTTATMSGDLYAAKYSFVYTSGVAGTIGSQAYSMPFYAYTPFASQNAPSKTQGPGSSVAMAPAACSSGNSAVPSAGASTVPTSLVAQTAPSLPSTSLSNVQDPATPTANATSVPHGQSWLQQQQPQSQPQVLAQGQTQPPPALFPYPPTSTAPLIARRTEDVCKNYVIHELSQSIPSKPPWNDTMSAMFGDHVQWDEVKVFTGKGRPSSRPSRACPITGLPAKYCDPRTNVPFANVSAYEILSKVIGRGFVWCTALGCYVGMNETGRTDKDPCGEVERGAKLGRGSVVEDVGASVGKAVATGIGVAEGVIEEQDDGNVEDQAEELMERTAKRRRVEVKGG